MPLGKTTSSSGGPGITTTYDMGLVNEEIKELKQNRNMLRDILEGHYDEFASPDLLEKEADEYRKDIAARKRFLEAYNESQAFRDAVAAEQPMKVSSIYPVEGETQTYTGKQIPTKGGLTVKTVPPEKAGAKEKIKQILRAVQGAEEIPGIEERLSKVLGKEAPSAGQKVKGALKMAGADLVRGLAFAPAFEFMSPPSLNPLADMSIKEQKKLLEEIKAQTRP